MMQAFAEFIGPESPLALLIRVTIVLAIAWTCDAALRWASPRWRIFSWRVSVVGAIVVAALSYCPPAMTLPLLPVRSTPINDSSAAAAEATHASRLSVAALPNSHEDATRSAPSPPLPLSADEAESRAMSVVDAKRGGAHAETASAAPTTKAAVTPSSTRSVAWSAGAWYIAVWALGVVVVVARFVSGSRRVARLVAVAQPVTSAVREQAAAIAQRRGVPSTVDVRLSTAAMAPCSAGIWRPVILLPARLCRDDSTAAVQCTLAHELAHVAGRDLMWNAALELLAALLWFHPLAWRMRVAHADACDERCDAVAANVTADADGYGRLLAQVALQVAGGIPAVALPMARTPQVLRRIGLLSSGRGVARLSRRRVVVVAILGAMVAATLGMLNVGRREAAAAPTARQAAEASQAKGNEANVADDKQTPRPHLSGRIIDDMGAPVTDAIVTITGNKRSGNRLLNHFEAKTDDEGRYAFDKVTVDDTYRLRVESKRWVGISYVEASQLQLTPTSQAVHDLTLRRACRIRIRTVDEARQPIAGANIYSKKLSSDPRYASVYTGSVQTGKDGWAEIGGLAPSDNDYLFGTSHNKFAFGKLIKKLDDPTTVLEEKIVLVEGEEVAGIAVCSDGKPAAGWTINAMPDWWKFGATPRGVDIGKNGEFKLQHISAGSYDVTVNVPEGGGMSRSVPAASGKKLPLSSGVLDIELSIPSPASAGKITGTLKLSGDRPQESIFIEADSEDRRYHASSHVSPGETDFSVNVLAPGIYTLRVSSTEIEEVVLRNVKAPSDEIEIAVKVVGKPVLRGRVVDDAGQPVTNYRVRVTKAGYLRGPNYVQDSQWQSVENAAGEFSVPLVGPGIYQATVAADGWAPTRSEPINTDELPQEPFALRLTRGVTLQGMVVDEAGRPIDGATVAPRSASAAASMPVRGQFPGNEGAVKTVDGKFTLANLPAGTELLRVTHPDYCFTLSDEIAVADADVEVAPITLTRGGTVRGTAYDSTGEPQPNVEIMFNDASGYGGFDDERTGRLASVTTDAAGKYEVSHLPPQLCYVHLAEEWEKAGVVRSAILPADGETRTLDFGGPRGVSGRLLVNGKPLANARLQLGGDNPHFGVFKAYTQSAGDGRFAFGRPPAGGRVLWQQPEGRSSNWVRLAHVEITDETTELGDINVQSGTVSIAVTGLADTDLSEVQVSLLERDPTWIFTSNDTGVQTP